MKRDEVDSIMKTDELYSTQHQRRQFGVDGKEGDLYRYMRKCAELWFKGGVIKKEVKVDGLIDDFAVKAIP